MSKHKNSIVTDGDDVKMSALEEKILIVILVEVIIS